MVPRGRRVGATVLTVEAQESMITVTDPAQGQIRPKVGAY